MSPPESDDAPTFAEPWQAQVFALATLLSARGYFTWTEWSAALSDAIKNAAPPSSGAPHSAPDDGSNYYCCWLAALEHLVQEKGLCDPQLLLMRKHAWTEAYRRTPHGKPVLLEPQ